MTSGSARGKGVFGPDQRAALHRVLAENLETFLVQVEAGGAHSVRLPAIDPSSRVELYYVDSTRETAEPHRSHAEPINQTGQKR